MNAEAVGRFVNDVLVAIPPANRIFAVVDAMERDGGAFVRHVALLWRHGDPDNRRRVIDAFPEYFVQYARVAALHARRAGARDLFGSENG